MQKILLFSFHFFAFTGLWAQRHDFSLGYGYSTPGKAMRQGFTDLHNVIVDYRYSPKRLPELSMGAFLQYGNYASRRQPQFYTYPDGTFTQTTVLLTSSIATLAGTVRYVWLLNKKIRPYAELQAGWFAMYSNYFIENPHNIIDGLSLDQATVQSDDTYLLSAGTGIQFDLSIPKTRSRHSIELGVRSVRGGEIDYSNMRRLKPLAAAGSNTPTPLRTIILENIATTRQYQNSQIEVYTHPLRLLQVHVTYQFSLPVRRS
jgi:hypothetical protein